MLHAKDILTDWVKNGTMFSVARWLSGESLLDRAWQMSTLYTLVGFTAYQLSSRNIVDTDLAGTYKPIADDWIKFGTMFIVARMLSGGSLFDTTWIMSCVATLIGFTVYNLVVTKYVKGSELSNSAPVATSIDDATKWAVMFLVSRLITCESVLDPKWAASSIATIVGFIAYDLLVSHAVDRIPLSS